MLLALLVVGGCASEGDPAGQPGGSAGGSDAAPPAVSPPQPDPSAVNVPVAGEAVAETIDIEGTPEIIDARRVQAPESFPLRFTTVIPADMAIGHGDDPAEIRIEAEFGGTRRPDAHFSIGVLPDGMSEEQAAAALVAADPASEYEEETSRYSWAARSYRLAGRSSGFLALGEREGRWFYVRAAYPPEFGDGMAPRIDLILRRWTWADGSSLAPEPAR